MTGKVDVLVIDRNHDDVFLAMRALSRAGLNPSPVRVETPRELGAALAAHAWDLVLCDGLYPLLSLSDVVAAVRDALPHTPLVVLSSRVAELEAIRDYVGLAGVVAKDALDSLPATVRSALASHGAAAPHHVAV
jgi:CheY-like chemotaxis protein